MFRRSLRRAVAALLVAIVFTVAVPTKADAAVLSQDALFSPVKLWNAAIGWVHNLWSPPSTPVPPLQRPPKFGAGQSSDGRSKSSGRGTPLN